MSPSLWRYSWIASKEHQASRWKDCFSPCGWGLMAHFHHRVRVGSVCKGAARVAFPPPKVGVTRTEPYWEVLVSLYYSVEVLRRLKGSQLIWATHAVRWFVDRITSVRQGDNNKQTQYLRDIYGQWRKLCLLKKMLRKSLLSFYVYVAAVAIARLKPCPT